MKHVELKVCMYILKLFNAIPEPSGHHEHPGRRVRHDARCGRGRRPDHAAEAPRSQQLTRALQQLEPGLHHPPLRWQGRSGPTQIKHCAAYFLLPVFHPESLGSLALQ